MGSRVAIDETPVTTTSWLGLPIAVEVKGGDVRYPGTSLEREVPSDVQGYGYFPGLEASDGDSLDVILGPHFGPSWSGTVYLAVQNQKDTQEFLQFKPFLGFDTEVAAKEAFFALWPSEMFGGMQAVPADRFRSEISELVDEDAGPSSSIPDEARQSEGAVATSRVVDTDATRAGDASGEAIFSRGAELEFRGEARTDDATMTPPALAEHETANLPPDRITAARKAKWRGHTIVLEAEGGSHRDTGHEQAVPDNFLGTGYFKDFVGRGDGDHLDVVLGPDVTDESDVYMAVQLDGDEFRQFKILIGFASEAQAEAAYRLMWKPTTLGGLWRVSAKEFERRVLPRITKAAAPVLVATSPSAEAIWPRIARTAAREATVNPHEIEPPHDVKNISKYERLVEDMRVGGWQGRPILVYMSGGSMQALTGSHRIAAAREAGLTVIPVLVIEDHDFPDPGAFTRLDEAGDNYDRLRALEKARKLNPDLQDAYDLMLREVAEKNKSNTRTSAVDKEAAGFPAALGLATGLAMTPMQDPAGGAGMSVPEPGRQQLEEAYQMSLPEQVVPRRKPKGPAEQRAETNAAKYTDQVLKAATDVGIDPALLDAVIWTESKYDTAAMSGAGAEGLLQLTKITQQELGVQHPFSAKEAIPAGARYLRRLLNRFNGNVDLAVAAYNAGPGKVLKYQGVPPFPETQDYVARVKARMQASPFGKSAADPRVQGRGKSLAETKPGPATIYRGVLTTVTSFRPNDYVTLSLKFAKGHAEHIQAVEEEPTHVLAATVPAEHVFEAFNPGEYFYAGPEVPGRVVARIRSAMIINAEDIPTPKHTEMEEPDSTLGKSYDSTVGVEGETSEMFSEKAGAAGAAGAWVVAIHRRRAQAGGMPNLFWEDASPHEGAGEEGGDTAPITFHEASPEEFEAGISQVDQSALDTERDPANVKRLFISMDGHAGYALGGPDGGEIKWVWSTKRGYGRPAMQDAIRNGGHYLDCMDNGKLAGFYASLGFQEWKRAPNWTPGGPDVVWMELPGKPAPREPGDEPAVTPGAEEDEYGTEVPYDDQGLPAAPAAPAPADDGTTAPAVPRAARHHAQSAAEGRRPYAAAAAEPVLRRGPRLEVTAADVECEVDEDVEDDLLDDACPGKLKLKRSGYQRYRGTYEGQKVWIGCEAVVEHGSYGGNQRQRRKPRWLVKVDGKEVGEGTTLREAKAIAEASLGIIPEGADMAPEHAVMPTADDLMALIVTAADLGTAHAITGGYYADREAAQGNDRRVLQGGAGSDGVLRTDARGRGSDGVAGGPGGAHYAARDTGEAPLEATFTYVSAGPLTIEAKPKGKPKKRKKDDEDDEASQPWEPQPISRPHKRDTLTTPVYDPHTKTTAPWSNFKQDPSKLQRTTEEGFEESQLDQDYLDLLELRDEVGQDTPPPTYKRDPSTLGGEVRPMGLKDPGDQGYKNIVAVLSKATPEELDYWQHWYGRGHVEVVKLARQHSRAVDLCAGVVAVLSPKEFWETNLYLADRALAQDWANVKTMNDNREKAYSLVVRNDFGAVAGPKVFPFFLSLADPVAFQHEVVIDTHAINIWRGSREGKAPTLSPGPRRRIAEDYARAAAEFGLTPQACQAITWVLWRQYPTLEGTAPIETDTKTKGPGKGRLPEAITEDMLRSQPEEHLYDLPEEEFTPPLGHDIYSSVHVTARDLDPAPPGGVIVVGRGDLSDDAGAGRPVLDRSGARDRGLRAGRDVRRGDGPAQDRGRGVEGSPGGRGHARTAAPRSWFKTVRVSDLKRALKQLGYKKIRTWGDHEFFSDGVHTTQIDTQRDPVDPNVIVGDILPQMEITGEVLLQALGRPVPKKAPGEEGEATAATADPILTLSGEEFIMETPSGYTHEPWLPSGDIVGRGPGGVVLTDAFFDLPPEGRSRALSRVKESDAALEVDAMPKSIVDYGAEDRTPNVTVTAADLDLSQYDEEWQQGRTRDQWRKEIRDLGRFKQKNYPDVLDMNEQLDLLEAKERAPQPSQREQIEKVRQEEEAYIEHMVKQKQREDAARWRRLRDSYPEEPEPAPEPERPYPSMGGYQPPAGYPGFNSRGMVVSAADLTAAPSPPYKQTTPQTGQAWRVVQSVTLTREDGSGKDTLGEGEKVVFAGSDGIFYTVRTDKQRYTVMPSIFMAKFSPASAAKPPVPADFRGAPATGPRGPARPIGAPPKALPPLPKPKPQAPPPEKSWWQRLRSSSVRTAGVAGDIDEAHAALARGKEFIVLAPDSTRPMYLTKAELARLPTESLQVVPIEEYVSWGAPEDTYHAATLTVTAKDIEPRPGGGYQMTPKDEAVVKRIVEGPSRSFVRDPSYAPELARSMFDPRHNVDDRPISDIEFAPGQYERDPEVAEMFEGPTWPERKTYDSDFGVTRQNKAAPDLAGRTGADNIRKVLNQATDEEVEVYKDWYLVAHNQAKMIAAESGQPLEIVAAVIAALSPGAGWEANLRAARRLCLGQSISGTGGFYPVSVYKAMRAIKTGDPQEALTGDTAKVRPFYETLLSPKESAKKAVVDRHMFAIWFGDPSAAEGVPPDQVRTKIQADVLEVAHEYGLSTQAVQAITWVLWRSRVGEARPATEVKPPAWQAPEERYAPPSEEEWEAWEPPEDEVHATRAAAAMRFPSKAVALDVILEDCGIGDEGRKDFGDADAAYKRWQRQYAANRAYPKPVYEGGELDSVNEALGLYGPRRVSGLLEAFEKLTVRVRTWNDPRLEWALDILAMVPGLENIRLPEWVLEHKLDKDEARYYSEHEDQDLDTPEPGYGDDVPFNVPMLSTAPAGREPGVEGSVHVSAFDLEDDGDARTAARRPRKKKRRRFPGETYYASQAGDNIARATMAGMGATPVEEVRLDPAASVLREGDEHMIRLEERGAGLDEIMREALELGYDAVRVKDRAAILNQDVVTRTPVKRPGWAG